MEWVMIGLLIGVLFFPFIFFPIMFVYLFFVTIFSKKDYYYNGWNDYY